MAEWRMAYDPKIRSLHNLEKSSMTILEQWSSEVALSYRDSATGLIRLAELIPNLVEKSITFEHILAESHFLSRTSNLQNVERVSLDQAKQILDNKMKMIAEETIILEMNTKDRSIFYIEAYFNSDQSSRDYQVYLGMLLSTMWTTFEVLANDLWIAALNYHPKTLSALGGRKARIKKLTGQQIKGDETPKQDSIDSKMVKLSLIQENMFDLSNSMGSILAVSQRFDSLDGIREAYSTAFSKRSEGIDSLLSRIELDSLSLLRNVILHNGGRCDKVYLSKSKTMPLCPLTDLGSRVQLDGESVVNLINPVIEIGYKLIEEVRRWMPDHPLNLIAKKDI